MVGVTPNFNGDTSVFYAGITYEFSLSNQITDALTHDVTKSLFVAGGISAALHDGPLHKNRLACRERSDCGFGYRVLPRLNIELGTSFWENHGTLVFYDHMSHKASRWDLETTEDEILINIRPGARQEERGCRDEHSEI